MSIKLLIQIKEIQKVNNPVAENPYSKHNFQTTQSLFSPLFPFRRYISFTTRKTETKPWEFSTIQGICTDKSIVKMLKITTKIHHHYPSVFSWYRSVKNILTAIEVKIRYLEMWPLILHHVCVKTRSLYAWRLINHRVHPTIHWRTLESFSHFH